MLVDVAFDHESKHLVAPIQESPSLLTVAKGDNRLHGALLEAKRSQTDDRLYSVSVPFALFPMLSLSFPVFLTVFLHVSVMKVIRKII